MNTIVFRIGNALKTNEILRIYPTGFFFLTTGGPWRSLGGPWGPWGSPGPPRAPHGRPQGGPVSRVDGKTRAVLTIPGNP